MTIHLSKAVFRIWVTLFRIQIWIRLFVSTPDPDRGKSGLDPDSMKNVQNFCLNYKNHNKKCYNTKMKMKEGILKILN